MSAMREAACLGSFLGGVAVAGRSWIKPMGFGGGGGVESLTICDWRDDPLE